MKNIKVILTVLLSGILGISSFAAAEEYSLRDLYRQSLKSSEQIKVMEENLFIAQMGKNKAFSVLIPRLTAFGQYNHYSENKYGPPPIYSSILLQPNESGSWGVRADQAFSLSARELNALTFAKQSVTKSEYDLYAAKSNFILSIAAYYYDVLKAKKALENATANLGRLTTYRNSVEKRVRVGELTKTALLRADGELSGARADYLRATNILKLARAVLIRNTGIEENFKLKDDQDILIRFDRLEMLRQTAFDKRADLKSYDMQTQMAEEQVKYARGAFWPNIGLFAVYNGSDQYPSGYTTVRETVVAGVSLTFPFFEGGLRVAEYKEAKARERQARLAFDDFRKNIQVELESAYLELDTQKETLKFLEDQLIFAQDNYDAVLRQYENGLATSLDVMDANNLLLLSEKNVLEAQYGYRLAQLKVMKASGTLLQFVEAK